MDSNVPASVVIGQDDGTEIHVQPLIQNGRRQLDVRIWRRGNSGFAPSRNALVVQREDLSSLQQGIAELLEASDGGRQAARIVWDDDDTRRLRAETEPFGTRYLASFAFWQRVRDTWKAADDGLVLAADRLEQLQDVLARVRPWMDEEPVIEAEPAEDALQRHALYGWPSPGADWVTIAPGSIAFHPRGVRITCTVAEDGDDQAIVLRPWRKMDSLWVPEDTEIALGIVDLDSLLFGLARLIDERAGAAPIAHTAPTADSVHHFTVSGSGDSETLTLEQRSVTEDDASQRLSFPYAYASRFGRMLLQAGSFLVARMSDEERDMLQQSAYTSPSVVAYESLPEAIRYEVIHGTAQQERDAHHTGTGDGDDELVDDIGETDAGGDAIGHEAGDETPAIRTMTLQVLSLGERDVTLSLAFATLPLLCLTWDEGVLSLPADGLAAFAADLRVLYYDALFGRRGRAIHVEGEHAVAVSLVNRGTEMYCRFESGEGAEAIGLYFPANQVPVFLDATQAALAQIQREMSA